MNVCFQNHIEEKQYSETTLLATHNDRNRRNTLKQTNNILRLSAGHPLPLPIARLLGTRFRFDFFSKPRDFWECCFLSWSPRTPISGFLEQRVSGCFWYIYIMSCWNQDSSKTPAKPFVLVLFVCFVFCRGAKTSGKLVLKAKNTSQLQ